MIHAYDNFYLPVVQMNLGAAFDVAVHGLGYDPDDFYGLFLASKIAAHIENGSSRYVAGMSGTELVEEVLCNCGLQQTFPSYSDVYSRSPEYWGGWILAYYQWHTNHTFKDIHDAVSMNQIIALYHPLHEAPEEKSVEIIQGYMNANNISTNLQRLRKSIGITQKQLADASGVNLRTLQQYEVRAKDINKASAETINALARVLSCNFYDIMELGTD